MILAGFVCLRIIRSVWAMYASAAVGFVLFFFIAQMIADRSFNVLSKAVELWKFCAVLVAAFALILLITKADIFGFSKYVPDLSAVEGVYINNINGSNLINPMSDSPLADNTLCTDRETIAVALSVHKQIIDSRVNLQSEYLKMIENKESYSFYGNDHLYPYKYFVYRLKNGRTVAREYFLSQDFIKTSGLLELINRDDILLSVYPSLKTPEEIKQVDIWFDSWPDKSDLKLDSNGRFILTQPEQIESISKEIKKDIIINVPYTQYPYVSMVGPNGESATAVETDRRYITINTTMRNRLSKYGVSTYGDMLNLVKYDNILEWLRDNGYFSKGTANNAVLSESNSDS